MTVFLNGDYLPLSEARVSPEDRGFLFADGVYEVTRTASGRLFLWEEHWQRLRYGLGELRIPEPPWDLGEVSRELLERNAPGDDAIVYLQVTRGQCPRSHRLPPAETRPTVYGFAKPMPDIAAQVENGIAAATSEDLRWGRCDIKSIGLLANSLAYEAAHEAGAKEAVLLRDGAVTEGAHTNAFFVKGGTLLTPPEGRAILSGITRRAVIALAGQAGVPVETRRIEAAEIPSMDEMFVTGTTSDVTPVVRCDGAPVGAGEPGPLTRRLQAAFREMMRPGAG